MNAGDSTGPSDGFSKERIETHGSAIRRSVSFMIRFGNAMVNGQWTMRNAMLSVAI